MKKTFYYCFLALFALLLNLNVQAQNGQPNASKLDAFIAQVYTGEGVSQIAKTTRRYAFMKEVLSNRIRYVKVDAKKAKLATYRRLSQVELYDTYNKALQRDYTFNAQTFNPFKYKFDFYSKTTQQILVDDANVLIVIQPHKYPTAK